jgi:hypothetical protein
MNLWFAANTKLSAMNQRLLPKVLFCNEFVIHYRNLGVCNELAFVAEVELFCNESAFAVESVLTVVKLWFAAEIELSAAN